MTGNNITIKSAGFTMVEAIVAISIFLFIIGALISLFTSFVANQRNIIYEQKVLNQMSYVQEYMSKAIRMAKVDEAGNCIRNVDQTGYIYILTRAVETGTAKGIKFINQSDGDSCYEFFLDDTDPSNTIFKVLKNSTNDADAVSLTSSDIKIESVKFAINGDPSKTNISIQDADIQPRITFVFTVVMPNGTKRVIQTTVSQRNFN